MFIKTEEVTFKVVDFRT